MLDRFRHVVPCGVAGMWHQGVNDKGEPLTSFEWQALIERYLEIFGMLPEAWIDAWVRQMFKLRNPSEEGAPAPTPLYVEERLKEAAYRHDCRLAIVPWMNVMRAWPAGRPTWLDEHLYKLQVLARSLGMTVFLEINPTQQAGGWSTVAKASPYHIAGGAAWQDQLHVAIAVFSPDPDCIDTERHVRVMLSRDQRLWGRPGTVSFDFSKHTGAWSATAFQFGEEDG